ncbi:hypothetical protein ACP26L_33085 [Paenibacillus sp. S-38]|uniref:hypothetical protein n=1 Tax=Paenibacillus sp. S-38 TaxID=3416710 RepID=UPI003CE78CEB
MRRDPKELLTAEEWKALLEQSEEWVEQDGPQELAALRREVEELRTAVLALNDRLCRLEGKESKAGASSQRTPQAGRMPAGQEERGTEPVRGGTLPPGDDEDIAMSAGGPKVELPAGTAEGAPEGVAEAAEAGPDAGASMGAAGEAAYPSVDAALAADEAEVRASLEADGLPEGEERLAPLETASPGEQAMTSPSEAGLQGERALLPGRLESAAAAEPESRPSEQKREASSDHGGESVMLSRVQKYAKKKKRAAERSGRWFS